MQTNDYRKMVNVCYLAIKAVEAFEQVKKGDEESFNNIVLPALSGQQRYARRVMFKALHESAQSWLKSSPWWRSVDIVCWDESQDGDDARKNIISALGQATISPPDESLKILHKEVTKELSDVCKMFNARKVNKTKWSKPLSEELDRLSAVLQRGVESLTVREVGSASGTLAEALVNWLAKEFDKGVSPKKTFPRKHRIDCRRQKQGSITCPNG